MDYKQFILILVSSLVLAFSISVVMFDSVRGLGAEQYLQMHGGARGGILG